MTAERNSFKLLAEDDARRYPKAPQSVEKQINGTMGFVRMISNVIELYLPRIFDVMITMVGGEQPKNQSKRRDPAGRQGHSPRS